MDQIDNCKPCYTLPILCQICLQKVVDPWTCCNQHVFCNKCINAWLTKQNNCPVCRVQVTPQSPIRPVIGGLLKNEDDSDVSCQTKFDLRRTRIEIIMKDYESDIKNLESDVKNLKKENKDLNKKLTDCSKRFSENLAEQNNSNLCLQCLKPLNIVVESQKSNDQHLKSEISRLENKEKSLKEEIEKLKKENEQIKDQVLLQSPTRMSRATVASLEKRLEISLKESARLEKALSRSDAYIESLKEEIAALEKTGKSSETSNKVIKVEPVLETKSLEKSSSFRKNLSFDLNNLKTENSLISNSEMNFEGASYIFENTSNTNGSAGLFDLNHIDCEIMNDGITAASNNLLEQFNNGLTQSTFNIDDFIEPSSSSSLGSEPKIYFENVKDEDMDTTLRPDDIYSSSTIMDDVLLSQDSNSKDMHQCISQLGILPTSKTTTINAGGSRITMSRLSPEEQKLFNRPSSAPSKTFLLNSSLFSSIQPLDEAGSLESPGCSGSLKNKKTYNFQPYKRHKTSRDINSYKLFTSINSASRSLTSSSIT